MKALRTCVLALVLLMCACARPASPKAAQPPVVTPEFAIGAGSQITQLALSAGGELLAAADAQGVINLWNVRGRTRVQTFRVEGGIVQLTFDAAATRLMVGTSGTVVILPVSQEGEALRIPVNDRVVSVAFSQDGQHIAVGTASMLGMVVSAVANLMASPLLIPLQWLRWYFQPAVGPCAPPKLRKDPTFKADLQETAPSLAWFDSRTGQKLTVPAPSSELAAELHKIEDSMLAAYLCADGKSLALGQLNQAQPKWQVPFANAANFAAMAVDARGTVVALGGKQGELKLLDGMHGKPLWQLGAPLVSVTQLAFSPDGRSLASISGKRLDVWDLSALTRRSMSLESTPSRVTFGASSSELILEMNGALFGVDVVRKTQRQLLGPESGKNTSSTVDSLCVSPDGTLLAIGYPDKISLLDLKRRQLLKTISAKPESEVVLSKRELIYLEKGYIHIEPTTAGQARKIVLPSVPQTDKNKLTSRSLAISKSGRYLALSTGPINIFDLESARLERSLRSRVWGDLNAHDGRVSGLFWEKDRLVSLSSAGEMKLWDTTNGDPLGEFQPDAQATYATCDSLSRWCARASNQGTIHLIDVAKAQAAVVLAALEDGEQIVWTADGFYSATVGALDRIWFRAQQGGAAPFHQFDPYFNRPDLVLERLGHASESDLAVHRAAVAMRKSRLGVSQVPSAASARPTVLLSGLPTVTSTEKKISFAATVADAAHKVEHLLVRVNGVQALDLRSITQAPGQTEQQAISLELSNGTNSIEVVAINAAGVESLAQIFNIEYVGESPPSRLFVVAVGISQYAQDITIENEEKGVEELITLLAEADPTADVVRIPGADGNREQIAAALARVASLSQVDDRVLLFLGGHGYLDPTSYAFYFGTQDIDPTRPSLRGLGYDEIEAQLAQIKARQKLLLIDACHAGGGDREDSAAARRHVRQAEVIVRALFVGLPRSSGATVLVSSTGQLPALSPAKLGRSFFIHAVLEGWLLGRAADDTGDVRLSKLGPYVQARIRSCTHDFQVPGFREQNVVADFVLPRLTNKVVSLNLQPLDCD